MIRGNFHTHTTFCDGQNSAQEMAEQAVSIGFTHLGFSGHMDAEIRMDLKAYDAEIRRLQRMYGRAGEGNIHAEFSDADRSAAKKTDADRSAAESPAAGAAAGAGDAEKEERPVLDILRGVELDCLYEPESREEADLLRSMEYLIGSTHYIEAPSGGPIGSVDDSAQRLQDFCREEFGGDYYRLSKAYYETEAQVYERTRCTFVGHFDLVTRFNDDLHFLDEEDRRYRMPALETMEYLAAKGLPFEINCGAYNRGRKKELYPNRFFLRALREMGGEILINSDAHQKELLDGGFAEAVRTATACGFTHTCFLEHDPAGKVVVRQVPLDLF